MEFKVIVYKKKGYLAYGTEDIDKLILHDSLVSINISRNRDTPTSEATIVAQFEHLPMAEYQGGNTGIIDNFARMEIYFEQQVQFTGIIKKYNYDENERTITLTCHDMIYRLLNASTEPIAYTNITASGVIADLVSRAGLEFNIVGGTDYPIPELKIDEGTVFLDIIQNILETMHGIIKCRKDGVIELDEQYPDYVEGGGDVNHFDWTYKSNTNVSTATAGRDASQMHNILRITCENHYTKFEDKSMTSYLNGEYWYTPDIENAVANTQQKRKAVAGFRYLEMWRNSTPLTILPVSGQREHDMGQVVKLIRDGIPPGYYLVVGITTDLTADGFMDTLQLQGMRDKRTIYQIPTFIKEGIIDQKLESPKGKPDEDVPMEIYCGDSGTLGTNDVGFLDILPDTTAWRISMNCLEDFKTKENDGTIINWGSTLPSLSIIDPNGVEYGIYSLNKIPPFYPTGSASSDPNADAPSAGYVESTSTGVASKMTYSGYKSNPEEWYVYSPLPGRWRIKAYSFCDTIHPDKLHISIRSNLEWTVNNHQGTEAL